jgi:hypothetical protein
MIDHMVAAVISQDIKKLRPRKRSFSLPTRTCFRIQILVECGIGFIVRPNPRRNGMELRTKIGLVLIVLSVVLRFIIPILRAIRDRNRFVLSADELLLVLSEKDWRTPGQLYELLKRRHQAIHPNFEEDVAVTDVKIVLNSLGHRVTYETDTVEGQEVRYYRKQPRITMDQLHPRT